MAIVYQATNLINGKCYIGVSKYTLVRRMTQHLGAARRKETQSRLHRAIRKYGKENFYWSILESHGEYDEAIKAEIRLIGAIVPEYNLTAGGQGTLGLKWSTECREKQKLARQRGGYRPVVSDKCRQASIEACKGKPGYWAGKKRSAEDIGKASRARLGRKQNISDEEKLARRERAIHMRSAKKKKPIICASDGRIFDTAAAAGRAYGVTKGAITHCVRGRSKSAAGRRFTYVEDLYGAAK